jgi:hypothetical protein
MICKSGPGLVDVNGAVNPNGLALVGAPTVWVVRKFDPNIGLQFVATAEQAADAVGTPDPAKASSATVTTNKNKTFFNIFSPSIGFVYCSQLQYHNTP